MTDHRLDTGGFLSPSEAARRLALSVHRVRQLTRAGRLPSVMTPLGRLIHEDDVAALVQARRVKSGG